MIRTLSLAAAAALAAGGAQAHVVLQPATAAPGALATLHFVVGHGCQGQPTTAFRVELPSAVTLASAEAKPGWTLAVERTSPVAVTWRGDLPAHEAGGFEVKAKLPASPARLAFVAVQSCGETTVRWDEADSGRGPRPTHPAPILTLAAAPEGVSARAASATPRGVQVLNGAFADASGRPLYTFDFDTMVGMSHCEGDCAQMWPPLIAPKDAKPFGDWSLVKREDGSPQWAYKTKPLYTYSKDRPGGPPAGLEAPNWKLAK